MAQKLTKDDVIQYTVRLNLNIESHLLIHQTLQMLARQSRGTKSRFMVDSLLEGCKKLNGELPSDDINPDEEYVTRAEMKRNNELLVQEFSADILAKIISQTAVISANHIVPVPSIAVPMEKQSEIKESEEKLDDAVEEMAQLYAGWED